MEDQKKLTLRSWAELLLLAGVWGGSFLAFGLAVQEIPTFTIVAFRVTGGAMVLWAYVAWRGLVMPWSPKAWLCFLGMGLLNNVIPFSLIAWGQLLVPSGLASIFNASTAIFGVLLAALFFADEKLTARKMCGVVIGFGGVATAIGLGAFSAFNLQSLSQLAILGASVSYAFAGSFGRVFLGGYRPQVAATGMTSASALFILPIALWVDGMPTLDYGAPTWGALVYLAIGATAFAYLLYYRVLEMAGSGNLLLVTLLAAPVAIVLGAAVLDETLDFRVYVGFGLLALGLLVLDGRVLRRR
ncbi:MAG: DMT family transporter [Marinosulfonomonas sp.]